MSIKLNGPLLLAGAGNMGFALLSGWLERGLDPARVIVQDPAPPPRVKELLASTASTRAPQSARCPSRRR